MLLAPVVEQSQSPKVVAKLTPETCSELSLVCLTKSDNVILCWTNGGTLRPRVARYEKHTPLPYLYLPLLDKPNSEWLIFSLPKNFSRTNFLHIAQLQCFIPVMKLISHLTTALQKKTDLCLRITFEGDDYKDLKEVEDCKFLDFFVSVIDRLEYEINQYLIVFSL